MFSVTRRQTAKSGLFRQARIVAMKRGLRREGVAVIVLHMYTHGRSGVSFKNQGLRPHEVGEESEVIERERRVRHVGAFGVRGD